MSRFISFAFVLAAACTNEPTTGPVAATPLAGKLGTLDYRAKSARAKIVTMNGADRANVEIFPIDYPCGALADSSPLGFPTPAIFVKGAPWRAGTVREHTDVDSDMTVGIALDDGIADVDRTRIEIIEAPLEPGAIGKIRLRAFTKGGDEIAGEITVHVCE